MSKLIRIRLVVKTAAQACGGKPQPGGSYHRQFLSDCVPHIRDSNALVGYALAGFGIFSPFDVDGNEISGKDLDECHGTTSNILWDGKIVNMYHYVMTMDYPYTLTCFRGKPNYDAFPALPAPPSSAARSGGGSQPQSQPGTTPTPKDCAPPPGVTPPPGAQPPPGCPPKPADGAAPPPTAANPSPAAAPADPAVRTRNEVVQTYLDILGRFLEVEGLAYWASVSVQNGGDILSIRAAIYNSVEAIVRRAYLDFLGRAPDPEGAAYFQMLLQSGVSEVELRAMIANSPEALAR